ncbi:immunoglobulin-like domain-containing protein, partial [Aliarcobacter butzleri]|uniref:immunoglobulin-like domain-containing protein n=1 Tax=Aliarcobacter butzleri TaxID=28197 RepID=UPI003423EE9B
MDTEDVTTVTITKNCVNDDSGGATFTIELSNKPEAGSTATGKVQVGDKTYDVTFDADGKATLEVPVKANDVYKGEPTITAKVTEVNGGNFEKVSVDVASKTITVNDTEDVTTVTITGSDVNEGS